MTTYTKQVLATVLKEKMKSKPLAKITVTELVESCKINRQTFYYHFQDMYDLLAWIYKTEAINSISGKRSYQTWQEGLDIILEYVEENKWVCINTYRSVARDHLEIFLHEALFDLLGNVVDELDPTFHIAKENHTFITRFYSYAFAGVLIDWIANGLKTPYTEISQNISIIMDGNFQEAINKFSALL